ncbi:MAG: hypothetical protein ACPGVP_08690 [Thiolinea sp.]
MTKLRPASIPAKINNACLNAIEETKGDLGIADTVDLLSNSLPLIIERKNMINLALQESDLDRASLYAHKTLGSIRIYGTEKLESLLNRLKDKQLDERGSNDFHLKDELSVEFDSVTFTINEWLSLNRKAS